MTTINNTLNALLVCSKIAMNLALTLMFWVIADFIFDLNQEVLFWFT